MTHLRTVRLNYNPHGDFEPGRTKKTLEIKPSNYGRSAAARRQTMRSPVPQ